MNNTNVKKTLRTALVIGGTGTMGKPLVSELYNEGYKVFVVCRHSVEDKRNIVYYVGNAKDIAFMNGVLSTHYDVIVDFCIYSSTEFRERYEPLLSSTDKYICLSSSAVYADNEKPKKEDSPRYMEVDPPVAGENYWWYCYEKARIEDILRYSVFKNWVILRPGMTMNDNHFFWGNWIDEEWSFRIVHGNKVVIPRDMLPFKASITYGGDVTPMIMAVITDSESVSEIYNVTSSQTFSWLDLLDIYRNVFSKYGYEIRIKYIDSCNDIIKSNPSERYVYERARLLDRVFDSSKIYKLMDTNSKPFTSIEVKIDEWVKKYVSQHSDKIRSEKVRNTAFLDSITKEYTHRKYFLSTNDFIRYLVHRYFPVCLWMYNHVKLYLNA